MEKKSKVIIAVVIAVIVVASVTVVALNYKGKTLATPAIYSSNKVGLTNESISFSLSNSNSLSGSNITWMFGDGNIGYGINVSHAYTYPGIYLVEAIAREGSLVSNNLNGLYEVEIEKSTASISLTTLKQEISPTILFNVTNYPTAPIFNTSQNISAQGSYLEPPTASGWAIGQYTWYLDGSTTVGQVYNFTPSSAGLYPLILNITTSNKTDSHVNTFVQTILVKASSTSAAIATYSGTLSSSNVLTDALVVPGGFESLDPQIDEEVIGHGIILNTYETLVYYNGTSTTSFVPLLASQVPTVANGGVSANGLNWTFHIRANATFANGQPVKVFDVYFSLVRELLFSTGSPGTGGFTLAQGLLPGYAHRIPHFNDYANITKALTYSNATQNITLHLFAPFPSLLYMLAFPASSVMEYSWAAQHGAGLAFTPQGFSSYKEESIATDYNTYIQYNTMGSGPFTVSSVQPGESITLTPNKYYNPPAYGFPKSNLTVVMDFVKEASTATIMAQSDQAQMITSLPTSSLGDVLPLVSSGVLNLYTFPTYATYFFSFNFNINVTMLHSLGTQYTVPSHYFANQDVRKAFAFAFNYSEYIDSLLGNDIFHLDLGSEYVGVLPLGMAGSKPYNQWQNAPYYDLNMAKNYLYESGMYNVTVNIPIIVSSGDAVNYAAVSMLGTALSSIDSHITVEPYYVPFSQELGYLVNNENPLPIYSLGWATSIPAPINMIPPMYLPGGVYMGGNGVPAASALLAMGHPNQSKEFQQITNLSGIAATNPNTTQSVQEYSQANQIGINLTLYIYTYNSRGILLYHAGLNGVNFEENPIIVGSGETLFEYLTK